MFIYSWQSCLVIYKHKNVETMLLDWFREKIKRKKKIDVKVLPSQGYFYRDDFTISIKTADEQDIVEYESDYDRENFGMVLSKLKAVVHKNVILSESYNFNHIKSIDIVFLFLEIVKFTKRKSIEINYIDDCTGMLDIVKFDKENFNYFVPEDIDTWNRNKRCFDINGYSVSLPSIGIENSLTHYLIERSYDSDAEKYNDYNYNFTFFLDGKERLNFEEIDNLIQIFNFDIDEDEKIKVEDAVERIKPMQRYSLIKNGRIIDMSSKLNLEKIWK